MRERKNGRIKNFWILSDSRSHLSRSLLLVPADMIPEKSLINDSRRYYINRPELRNFPPIPHHGIDLTMGNKTMIMSPRRTPISGRRTADPRPGSRSSQDRTRDRRDDRHHPFDHPHPRPRHHPQKKPMLPKRHTPHPEPVSPNQDPGPFADRPRPGKISKKVPRTGSKP